MNDVIKELPLLLEVDPVFAAKHARVRSNYSIVQTCGACPEQYDVIKDGEVVGLLRLRNGHFSASHNSVVMYSSHPKGDGLFEDDVERDYHIARGLVAIRDRHEKLALSDDDREMWLAATSDFQFVESPQEGESYVLREGRRVGMLRHTSTLFSVHAGHPDGEEVYSVDVDGERPDDETMRLMGLGALFLHLRDNEPTPSTRF